MRCSDIEELLSAYANDELSRTQREFVEGHVEDCPDCREKLEELINVRRQLVSLRETSALTDIKEATMTRIKGAGVSENPLQRWLRYALAVVPVIVVVILLVAQLGVTSSPGAIPPDIIDITGRPPLRYTLIPVVIYLTLLIGILIIFGMVFRKRLAGAIAGAASYLFGIIGIYFGLYALLSPVKSDLSHIYGAIPILGLIIGIIAIRRHYRYRRAAFIGIFLCLSALVLNTIFVITYPIPRIWVAIVTAILPIGIIVYAFRREIRELTREGLHPYRLNNQKRRWKRPALIAAPIIVILAVLITLQPWVSSPQSIVVKAQSAIAGLQSYRISIVHTDETEEKTSEVEIEFIAPDRYHYRNTGTEFNLEFIVIGDEQYFKDTPPQTSYGISTWSRADRYSPLLSREYTLRMLDYLTEIKELTDSTVDGTVCLHYWGTYDYEKQLIESWSSHQERGLPPLSNAEKEERLEELRSNGPLTEIELWISKDDYLIRQMRNATRILDNNGDLQSSVTTIKFYDFNRPFTIEIPVDSQGKLLPGWTSTSPEYPHIGTDIQAEVDNYDPSNRKVNYSINITNTSTEILTDVDVKIRDMFPRSNINITDKIWFSWDHGQYHNGPYTLDPGETLEYSCVFGYDATSVGPEVIAETIEKSYVSVIYTQADGQQKMEMFHFEAPESIYTLSTDVPSYLVPVNLTASGEYRIEETGATYVGGRVRGEINGKDYLFVEINTVGEETPASPGVLVLDIRDKTSPRKVAYLSTNDDTRYIRGAALYGTILYFSADDYLWVIDVSNPSSPKELARLPGLDTNQMVISGEYAFINDGNHDIVTLDLSNPEQPEKIGNLPLSSSSGIYMEIHGDYLFTEANDILYTIDASSPSSLEIVNEHSFRAPLDEATPGIIYPYHIMGMEIEDEYVYVSLSTEGKVAIGVLDISKPVSPREIAFFRLKDRRFHGTIFVSGEKLYIFTRKSSGLDSMKKRLDILDISNPAEPVEKGFGIMPDSWSFFADTHGGSAQSHSLIDDYLYWFIGDSPNLPVIEIFDLSGL
ncbi:zf-HC2 domain-containing protein [Chloroflexota bacterium]